MQQKEQKHWRLFNDNLSGDSDGECQCQHIAEESSGESEKDSEKTNGQNKLESCSLGVVESALDSVNVADPFFISLAPSEKFDGNPTKSFPAWLRNFKDMIDLAPLMNERQKITHLKVYLSDYARTRFEELNLSDANTLDDAIEHLRGEFENDTTRAIARQALNDCWQQKDEKIFQFAHRLEETLKGVMTNESKPSIKRRLLDEFLDRIEPELGFEVKKSRPSNFETAFERAPLSRSYI